jgi:hypothetical protein
MTTLRDFVTSTPNIGEDSGASGDEAYQNIAATLDRRLEVFMPTINQAEHWDCLTWSAT